LFRISNLSRLERESIVKELKPYYSFDNDVSDLALASLPAAFETLWQSANGELIPNEDFKNRNLFIAEALLDTVLRIGILEVGAEIENKPDDYPIMLVHKNQAEEIRLISF